MPSKKKPQKPQTTTPAPSSPPSSPAPSSPAPAMLYACDHQAALETRCTRCHGG
jgi:hypothetical protein